MESNQIGKLGRPGSSDSLKTRRRFLHSFFSMTMAPYSRALASGEDTWPYEGVEAIVVLVQDHVLLRNVQILIGRELEIRAVDFLKQSLQAIPTDILIVSRRRDTSPPENIHSRSILGVTLAVSLEAPDADAAIGAVGIELRRDVHTSPMSNYPFEIFKAASEEKQIIESAIIAIQNMLSTAVVDPLRKRYK